MRAPSPAPDSTTTFKPSPFSFRTVSGVAATRASPARRSLMTASFIDSGTDSAVGPENCEEGEKGDGADHLPLHESDEPAPGPQMFGHVGMACVLLRVGVC